MNHQDIRKHDILKLKPERQEAYGKDQPLVMVDEKVYKNGYKTPWIRSGAEFYAPSDFRSRTSREGT